MGSLKRVALGFSKFGIGALGLGFALRRFARARNKCTRVRKA